MLASGGGLQGVGEGTSIGGRHEETRVSARDLRHTGVGAGDDGGAVRHGLKDGQPEALPDRGEREDTRSCIGAGQVGVVEASEDVGAFGGQVPPLGVFSPPGGTHEDQVEIRGRGHGAVCAQQRRQVLAGFASADPQDVGAGQAVAGAEALHLGVGDGRVGEAVRDDGDESLVDARLDAVARGRLGGDDDRVGTVPGDVEGTVKVGGPVGGEVAGIAQERDVVNGDHQRARGRGNRPGGRVHDLRSPARSDAEHPVHARHAQAVPRCVQEATRQRGVEHRNRQAYLFRGGFARAVSRGDADGAYPLRGQARGHFHDVSS